MKFGVADCRRGLLLPLTARNIFFSLPRENPIGNWNKLINPKNGGPNEK
jgi:hypothetical protein